jgi:uncharacterized protein (UPF0261 family)
VGLSGVPQVVVPGCVDFCVFHAGHIPLHLRERPVYDHNPEYTLVRASHAEMIELGKIFAERLNLARAPVVIAIPSQGLSIPNVPGGVFWNPEADADFSKTVRSVIRADIPVYTYERHVNSPEFGVEVAELFIDLMETHQ